MHTAIADKVALISAARPETDGIKHRAAERYNLLMRVAKLVSCHGEYACVIRDVSSTGVRLRLFHDLPAEKHLVLILGNGDSYFLENVWENEREAGFRFSARIDVAAFMAEASSHPKRQVRLAIDLPATLAMREFSCPVVIRDLSQNGSRIESERELHAGQHLRIKAHSLPQIFASVRWAAGTSYGLVFQNSFRLDELAQTVWAIRQPAERLAAVRIAEAAAVSAAKVAAAGADDTAQLRAG